MRLCDAETMRSLDQHAIHRIGIPGVVLMENAGRGTVELMLRMGGGLKDGITILCGRGNNGGDGFVIGRHLHNAGYPVRLFLTSPKENIQGDARTNLNTALAMGMNITEVLSEDIWTSVRSEALFAPVIVDALLGTGLHSEVTGLYRRVIEDLNAANRRVVAVDIPSGLDSSSGRPHGVAVRAQLTATYGLAKLGLVLESALPYVGELHVVDISIPRELLLPGPTHDRLMSSAGVAASLPVRALDGHKGSFGHLLVIAGSVGKLGAAVLTSHAALRSGVGLVTLAVPRCALGQLPGLWPEVMVEPLEDGGTGHLTLESFAGIEALLVRKDAIAMGPGLSTAGGVAGVVERVVRESPLPVVVDADGLNALEGRLAVLNDAQGQRVLTPHPGEAARLLGSSTQGVQGDRVCAVRHLARQTGATVLLKGARTLTANPAGRISVNPTGNPGMATGGTGDVLTGLIGGLLAQGMNVEEASVCGAYLHGVAGDLARAEIGTRALVAGDLIQYLGAAFRAVAGDEA